MTYNSLETLQLLCMNVTTRPTVAISCFFPIFRNTKNWTFSENREPTKTRNSRLRDMRPWLFRNYLDGTYVLRSGLDRSQQPSRSQKTLLFEFPKIRIFEIDRIFFVGQISDQNYVRYGILPDICQPAWCHWGASFGCIGLSQTTKDAPVLVDYLQPGPAYRGDRFSWPVRYVELKTVEKSGHYGEQWKKQVSGSNEPTYVHQAFVATNFSISEISFAKASRR